MYKTKLINVEKNREKIRPKIMKKKTKTRATFETFELLNESKITNRSNILKYLKKKNLSRKSSTVNCHCLRFKINLTFKFVKW